jgi:predicted lipoprotein with Yx(FWY)xxD motif
MRRAFAGAAAVLFLAACGGAGAPGGAASPSAAPAVKVANNAKLGKILVAANGMTLYVFDKDAKDTSNCYDTCATNWPALTTTGTPSGSGVSGALATTARKDGTKQVTLDGKPLYFYAADKNEGDANGDGVGGIWHVVKLP